MSILGNAVIRKEDPNLLRGRGRYVDNLDPTGVARVAFVRSTLPHARIRSIDVEGARAAPGVLGVFTAEDLDFGPLAPMAFFPQIDQRFLRWPLARDVVRFVGEAVVAVVAESREAAADATEQVVIDYEPLPVVADLAASMREDVLLFPDLGTNVCATLDLPPIEGLLDGADVIVEQRMVNRRVAPAPLEGRAISASWDGERLEVHASTQGVALTRTVLAERFGLDPEAVRVVALDVGGGFGSKGGASPEELIVVWLALRLGRSVRWAESRTENLTAMGHGRGQQQTVTIGATRDGRIVGMHLDIAQEAGAYAEVGAGLPAMTMLMASGVYQIPRIAYTSRAWLTNTTPVGAFRGAGRPEAAYAIERALDVLARRLEMDPSEVRRRNFIPADAFPVTTPVGAAYDSGAYEQALDRVLEAAGYEDLRAEQERRRRDGDARLLGIGLSCYVEITGAMPGPEPARVEVHEDGSATVYAGSTPHGQSHVTSFAMIAADHLGIPFDRVDVVYGDTAVAPPGGVTGGSRTLQVCGTVVGRASEMVVEQARSIAAQLLEAAPDDVVLDTEQGRFHVAGTPAVHKTWTDVVAAAGADLSAETTFEPPGPTFPFGANLSVVEVDRDTGRVEVLRMVGCDDAGRILNPLIFEGQLHGGMAQGIAQAVLEEVVYDGEGNPLTANFADYPIVSSAELPSFELHHMETPTPLNELGAKGIGESGTVGATPCVVNAVVDALAHLGIEHLDMPTSPLRVWSAMRQANGA